MSGYGYTLVLPFVEQATRRFVKANGMREVISLALVSGEAAVMFGPGGYAKSELTRAVLNCIDGADVMPLVFHGKMDESDIYGGVDLGAINDSENPRIEYNAERSFLASDVFLMEEGLDAPARVLASLKNTMTSRIFENGRQRFPMKTRVVIMLTNKKPQDVVDVADEADRNSIAALMERFPLQIVVQWESHKAADFMEMFQAIEQEVDCADFSFQDLLSLQQACTEVHVPEEVKMVLSELISEAYEGGNKISPRTAVKALKLIQASAVINGRDVAVEDDIIACKYLPAMENIAGQIAQKVKAASDRAFAQDLIEDGWRIFQTIKIESQNASLIDTLKWAALLEILSDEVSQIKAPKEIVSNRDSLIKEINGLFSKLGGGNSEAYMRLAVELPERVLGIGYKVKLPNSGRYTIRELKQQAEDDARYADYEPDEDDDDDDDEDRPTPRSPFGRPSNPPKPASPFGSKPSSPFGKKPGSK